MGKKNLCTRKGGCWLCDEQCEPNSQRASPGEPTAAGTGQDIIPTASARRRKTTATSWQTPLSSYLRDLKATAETMRQLESTLKT